MSSTIDLKDKLAVVTGAGSGIGAAIAQHFAELGARVGILDISEEAGATVATSIHETGGKAWSAACDVSDHARVMEVFEDFVREHGAPDILVNNAGIAHIGTLETTTPEDFDRLYAVNVRGVYSCLHAAIGPMVKKGGGVILNMASIAANLGLPDRFAYSTTKGAIQTMTLSVARDYISKNIRCNCLCPARVHTPFVDNYLSENYPGQEKEMFEKLSQTQPIGRMAEPAEIAKLAAFICSDAAGFITGSSFDIDGGSTHLA